MTAAALKQTYDAAVLVELVDAFRAAGRPDNRLQWKTYKLGPLRVEQWSKRLREGEIAGWENYVPANDRDDPPYYLREFVTLKDWHDFENAVLEIVYHHKAASRNNVWPSVKSGPLPVFFEGKNGIWKEFREMLAGKTWREFSEMIRRQEGPFAIIFFGDEHGDYLSLHDFLVRKKFKAGKIDLTEDLVKEAIELHREKEGHYPGKLSGPVKHGRLAEYGEDWMAVDNAFHLKIRGLENSKADTLRHFMMDEGYLKIKLEDLRATVRAYLDHDEPVPNARSGVIKYGPLADGERTWKAVHMVFVKNRHFLAEPDCEYKTLHEFLVGEDFIKDIGPDMIPDIIASARATVTETGEEPHSKQGLIEHGPLKDQWKWSQIEQAAQDGKLGKYTSLHKLLVAYKVSEPRWRDAAVYPEPDVPAAAP